MLGIVHPHQTGGTDLPLPAIVPARSGEIQGCFNSTMRGYTMPVFTFEKISPPIRRGPIPPIAKKQRGVIVKILDRFAEARVTRTLREDKRVTACREQKPTDRAFTAWSASAGYSSLRSEDAVSE